MAKSPAAHSRLRHGRVLPDDRHRPVGAQDLRLVSRLLPKKEDEGRDVRLEARQLRVLPETTEAGDTRSGVCARAGESVCAASARHTGKTHLDDGWRRTDRLVP